MTKAELDLLPPRWEFQDFHYPNKRPTTTDRYVIVRAPAVESQHGHGGYDHLGGYVTIDFENRTFNLGMTTHHTMRARSINYVGRGWRLNLVRDAIKRLEDSLKGR